MGRRGNSTAWRRSRGITRQLHYAPPFVDLQRVCAQEVLRPNSCRTRPAFAGPTPTRTRAPKRKPAGGRWGAGEPPSGARGWRVRRDPPEVCRARVRPGDASREKTKTWRADSFGTDCRGRGRLAGPCTLGRWAQERPGPTPATAASGRCIRHGARHGRPPRRGGRTNLGRKVDHGQGSDDAATLGREPYAACRTVRGGPVVRCPTIGGRPTPTHAHPSCRPTPLPPSPDAPSHWC